MSPPSVSKSLCLAHQKPIKSTAIVLSTHVMAPSLFLSTLFKTRSMLCSSSAVEVNMTMFCINESNGPEVCACRGIERIRRANNNVLALDSSRYSQQMLQNISRSAQGAVRETWSDGLFSALLFFGMSTYFLLFLRHCRNEAIEQTCNYNCDA